MSGLELVQSKMPLVFIGGLGDVVLTRKLPYLMDSRDFEVRAIADVYSPEDVYDPSRFSCLLDEIDKTRLKKPLSDEVKKFLVNAVTEGKLSYFQMSPFDLRFPPELLKILENGALDISTPNNSHFSLLTQILSLSGCPVLVEKPAAASLEEASTLAELISNKVISSSRSVGVVEHYAHYRNAVNLVDNLSDYSMNTVPMGLGRIRGIELRIEEDEDFSNVRNRDIIDKTKSGGGVWLDMGIHAISLLTSLGGEIDFTKLQTYRFKQDIPEISDPKYQETQFRAFFGIKESEYFVPNACGLISVGKGFPERNKTFRLNYERGSIDLDFPSESLKVYNAEHRKVKELDYESNPFENVYDDFREAIDARRGPRVSLPKAVSDIINVFAIQEKTD